MDRSFDPYYIWLGIPPEDQPPNHYRLLGVKLFESNTDVLQSAADRQMVHLRTFQTGKHSALSQKLLNEVSAARVCLLNPSKKAAYDARLRTQLAQTASTEAIDPALAAVLDDGPMARRNGPPRLSVGKPSPQVGGVIAGGAVVGAILLLAVVGWFLSAKDNAPPVAEKLPQRTVLPRPAQEEETKPPRVVTDAAQRPPASRQPVPVAEPSRSVDTPQPFSHRVAPTPPSSPDAVQRDNGAVADEKRRQQSPAKKEPSGDSRLPVPSKEAREKAMRQARQVLDAELASATTVEAKKTLIAKVLRTVKQTDEDPEGAFALWALARELAIAVGDPETAVRIVEMVGERYRLDLLRSKSDVLKEVSKKIRLLPDHATSAELALEVVDAALDAGRFELATDLAELARAEAAKSRDRELLAVARSRIEQAEHAVAAFPNYAAAKDVLAHEPDDPNANLTVGGFLCFIKGDWDKGLPCFAQCSEAKLKALAGREISPPPPSPTQLVEIADGWWNLGCASDEKMKKEAMLGHAGDLYERAMLGLSGLARLTVEKRLKEIAKLMPQESSAGMTRSGSTKVDAGVVELKAHSAQFRGSQIRLERGLDGGRHTACLVSPKDTVSWGHVNIPRRGTYEVVVRVATVSDGPMLAVGVTGGAGLVGRIPSTGSYSSFQAITLGMIRIERSGDYQIIAGPFVPSARTWRPVNLASVTLKPVVRKTSGIDPRHPEKAAFLDDLNPTDARIFQGQLGKHGEGPEKGTHCRWKGAVPKHALCAQTIANGAMSISFGIDGRYKTFKAAVGINDGTISPTPFTFRVLGDGKLLWQSRPIQNSAELDRCNVSVRSVKTLTLEVVSSGVFAHAWAMWVDPCVAK